MTFSPGDCFTLQPDAARIYETSPRLVYRVRALSGLELDTYLADGFQVAVHAHEMLPHPGPPSAIHKKPRRRPSRDLRTPMQLFQADIYASIIRHKINALDAIVVLMGTANAIEAGTNEQAAADAVARTMKQPTRDLVKKLVDQALQAKAVPGI